MWAVLKYYAENCKEIALKLLPIVLVPKVITYYVVSENIAFDFMTLNSYCQHCVQRVS